MPARPLISVISALLIGLLLAACGEDAEQVTASELVSRGDEICAEGRDRFAEIQERAPANATDAEQLTDDLVQAATDELNELRELRPPDELREAYDRYLEARGSALDRLEEGRDAAAERDADAYAEAQAEVTADAEARIKLAQAVGFKVCSKPAE